MIRISGLFVMLCATFTAAQQGTFQEELLGRINELEACFLQKLDEHPSDDGAVALEKSSFTQLYIFDRVVSFSPPQSKMEIDNKFLENFCEQELWQPYLSAAQLVLENRKEQKNELAALGSAPIETDSWFIQFFHNTLGIGAHSTGHSDITIKALESFHGKNRFNKIATELISRASQLPDLYRWNTEAYHAHTPDYDPSDMKDRNSKIDTGVKEYRELLTRIHERLHRNIKIGEFTEALVLIGVGGHLVQDLVYHRGMTLRQHSGLSYFVRRDPDYPEGDLSVKRFEEALTLTILWIEKVRNGLTDTEWQSLVSWDKSMNLKEHADRVFSKQDISLAGLANYWRLHLDYRNGRNVRELEQGECGETTVEIACWKIADVLSEIIEIK
jgi:hypothetical protein